MNYLKKSDIAVLLGLVVGLFTIIFALVFLMESHYKVINKAEILERKLNTKEQIIDYLEEELHNCQDNSVDNLTATVYNAVPEQCNSDYLHTASMCKLDSLDQFKDCVIAISRDLKNKLKFGNEVEVIGTDYDGIYQVQDVMNKRYANRIDILINQDMAIGKWENIKIIKQ